MAMCCQSNSTFLIFAVILVWFWPCRRYNEFYLNWTFSYIYMDRSHTTLLFRLGCDERGESAWVGRSDCVWSDCTWSVSNTVQRLVGQHAVSLRQLNTQSKNRTPRRHPDGATENARPDIARPSKLWRLTSRDWTTRHHIARVDIARLVSLW